MRRSTVLSPLLQLVFPGCGLLQRECFDWLVDKPLRGKYAKWCMSVFHPKVGRIQVLAGLAPCSHTVGSLFRVIHE
jgi:hypothetical protein